MRLATIAAMVSLAASGAGLAQAPSAPAKMPDLPIPTLPGPDPNADLAYGAYQRGYYATAMREATLRLERDANDTAAMTLVGELYRQGLGVRQDFAKAADWYRLAAARGNAEAFFALGMMTLEGRGRPRDPKGGLELLDEAAGRGHAAASYNLALLLIGTGEPANLARAVELLRRASEAEIGDAQYALAVQLRQGRGVARDVAAAAASMKRAADNGTVAAEVEYAIMMFNGEGVAKDEAMAAKLFARAAGRGNAIAQNRLARILVVGRGMRKNLVEAAAWHLAASSQGLTDPWLDDNLKILSADDRRKAEELARRRSSGLELAARP
jgi:TPR repeat protein